MRYTMDVNAQGRQLLLNAGGIVESHFFTAACSMEVSASVYQNWWRFDMESLPADLIQRGMAVQDATEPHGLKLLIEDYPYATDGLLILSAIEQLVQAYVHYYYPEANIIESDSELNAWYHESINIVHADIQCQLVAETLDSKQSYLHPHHHYLACISTPCGGELRDVPL
ncbi:hypothetical protein ERO13_A09G072601v2 [Gossypium hirsutum]|nr:hypothetical protein ERO13_A09G072601v2 [Gossypium hirsutum]